MSDLCPDILYIWLHFGEVPFKTLKFSILLGSGATIEHNKSSRTTHTNPQIHWTIIIITLSLKIMSCPAVSCSKCVSGDVNCLRPCANSHLMLTKRNPVSPIGLFSSSFHFFHFHFFVLEHQGNIAHSQEQSSGFPITQPLLYLHTNCAAGVFFFPFF